MAYLTPYKLKNMTPGDRVHRRLTPGSLSFPSTKKFQTLEIVRIDSDREKVYFKAIHDRPVFSFYVDLLDREDEDFIHRLRPGAW